MPSLAELKNKARELTCEPFDGFTVHFSERLVIQTKENEEKIAAIALLQEKADAVGKDESLTDEQKAEKLKEIEYGARKVYESWLCLRVAKWDLTDEGSETPIPLALDALEKVDVPLEVYVAMFKAMNETALVPNSNA
ncbi:MAG TPA: hypothetical protein VGL56_14850 [Fimbriimonadaceae bacterium]|jgi:hypothetical protein